MKKTFIILLVLMMFAGICLTAGCRGFGCYDDDVCDEEKKSNVKTTLDFPNEEKLGQPLYKENTVVSSIESGTEEANEVLVQVKVDYNTTDEFETVADWYKDQMGGPPTESTTTVDGNQHMTWQSSVDGYCNTIVLTETGVGTNISITKTKE